MVCCYVQWLYDTFPDETEDTSSYYSAERLQRAIDEIATEFMLPNGIAWIARIAGTPVGCAMAHPIEPGIAEIRRFFVLPAVRGNGIWRALLEATIARMGDFGNPTIRLDTGIFLTDAISLYRRMGFVEIGPYTSIPQGAAKTALFMEWSLHKAWSPTLILFFWRSRMYAPFKEYPFTSILVATPSGAKGRSFRIAAIRVLWTAEPTAYPAVTISRFSPWK